MSDALPPPAIVRAVEGRPTRSGVLGPGEFGTLLELHGASPFPFVFHIEHMDVFHATDPEFPLTIADVIGRRVVVTMPVFDPYTYGPPEMVKRGRIVIQDGMSVRYFDQLVREAASHPGYGVSPIQKAEVSKGLGGVVYATREWFHGKLVERGKASIPALVWGLGSPDPEVRDRCRWALDEIRDGGTNE